MKRLTRQEILDNYVVDIQESMEGDNRQEVT